MGKTVYVVTHAQSEHHVQGVVGGWHDTPLTELGRRQAGAIAARIADLVGTEPAELWSSDLKRAAETAEPIAERLGVQTRLTSDLREKSLGVAGGRPHAWLDGRWRPASEDALRLDSHDGIDGAESRRQVLTRVRRAMVEILARGCDTQIVVTHGFALTFVVAAWFELPIDAAGWIGFRPGSGGITLLQQDEHSFDRALLSFNDRAHLAGL